MTPTTSQGSARSMRQRFKGRSESISTHKGLILTIACVAQFMVVLDVSIVNVALPSIRNSLGFSQVNLQWILNAYTLSFAGLLLLGGRLVDIIGRRKVFFCGIFLFSVASLVGAIATSQREIIIARTLQGVGAAILSPSTLTIITTTFEEGRERAKALGAWSAVAGAGGAAGALFGGILTDYLSWRWTFLINVPIGIFEVVLAWMFLSEFKRSQATKGARLDVVGSALITFGLTAVVYGLVQGGNLGWANVETLVAFAIGAASMVFFVYYEAKIAGSPIIPLGIFRHRALSVANVAMFLVGGSIFASWYFLSLFMQEILGYSPLKAGLAFVPQTLAIITGAQISSRLISKIGSRPLVIGGPIITAIGLLMLGNISPTSSYLGSLFLPSILVTLGMGLCFTPLAFSATTGIDRHLAGLASGVLNTARQVGGAVGLAGLSSLALAVTNSNLSSLASNVHVSHHAAVLMAASHGYGVAMTASAVIAVFASLSALMLPKSPKRLAEAIDEELILGFEGA